LGSQGSRSAGQDQARVGSAGGGPVLHGSGSLRSSHRPGWRVTEAARRGVILASPQKLLPDAGRLASANRDLRWTPCNVCKSSPPARAIAAATLGHSLV